MLFVFFFYLLNYSPPSAFSLNTVNLWNFWSTHIFLSNRSFLPTSSIIIEIGMCSGNFKGHAFSKKKYTKKYIVHQSKWCYATMPSSRYPNPASFSRYIYIYVLIDKQLRERSLLETQLSRYVSVSFHTKWRLKTCLLKWFSPHIHFVF